MDGRKGKHGLRTLTLAWVVTICLVCDGNGSSPATAEPAGDASAGRAFGRRFLHVLMALAPVGFVALLAGWVTAEVGRQPYVVYGLLRTSDAASPISGDMVGLSALIFAAGYPLVFGAGTFYMLRVITAGTRPHGRHTHD